MSKKSKKVCILGHFGHGKNLLNGQTVKTKNLYNELKNIYGADEIMIVDTYNWKKNPIKLFYNCLKSLDICENLIILPAQNGVRLFVPLFNLINKLFKKNLIYAVVGGWLPSYLLNDKKLIKSLKKFNILLVETDGMKKKLNELGLLNVDVMFNFKNITVINEKELLWDGRTPLKVCTFSRVIKEKGIENAINVVEKINKKYKKTIYKLDIYGPISDEYKDDFEKILKKCEKYINYNGSVGSSESTKVLKKYDLLLFPTYYEGEGFAGTIIDAFSSGVPVLASDWKYNGELVKNEKNGFLFQTKNDEELVEILDNIYNKKYKMENIKKECLRSARKYVPEEAIKILIKYLNRKM